MRERERERKAAREGVRGSKLPILSSLGKASLLLLCLSADEGNREAASCRRQQERDRGRAAAAVQRHWHETRKEESA